VISSLRFGTQFAGDVAQGLVFNRGLRGGLQSSGTDEKEKNKGIDLWRNPHAASPTFTGRNAIAYVLRKLTENFLDAINLSAQTALRESIGRHELAQMITERETLGRELQRILDEKTNPWGITVQSVEVRDVRIPQGLEDTMSRQAQAERERQARIILGQAETEISNSFVQAAAAYAENPVALHLRAMNMLYEAIKEKGSMVIVPSSAVETMGLGGTLATASLGGAKP
jgi:regulator of protease activity HflC (stomatin/prohibitin superfamily)